MDGQELFAGMSLFFCLMGAFFFAILLGIVCLWRIFNRAGKPGIYAFIPVVSPFQWARISGLGTVVSGIYAFLMTFFGTEFFINGQNDTTTVSYIGLATWLMFAYVTIGLAKRFGKSTLFGLGLMFLPVIFYPILAFGDDPYQPA
jgi:hypothetical protein